MTVPVAGGTVKAADVTRLIAAAGATLTISSGSVTATPNSGHGFHKIAAETGTTDDLATVSGLASGESLLLLADSGDTITIKHGTGNFDLPDDGDITLEDDNPLMFRYDGSNLTFIGLALPSDNARIVTFTYTGDGTTDQGLTGFGGTPKFLQIFKGTADGTNTLTFWTSTELMADDAQGLALTMSAGGFQQNLDNRVITLDSDGISVSDDGTDLDPNKNGQAYRGVAIF